VPGLKRIALVGDPIDRDNFSKTFMKELSATDLGVIDLTRLPMAELKKRVSNLPDDAAIAYPGISTDGAGERYVPRQALTEISEVANRPIFVDAASIPVTLANFSKPVFDWWQLRRWDIDVSRLPPNSELRFRPPTLWEQYRWLVTAVLFALLVQAAMISWLLIERHRRRRAEIESRRRTLEVVHLNRSAQAGALSASFAHELSQPLGAIMMNSETATSMLDAKPVQIDRLRELLTDIQEADQHATDILLNVRGLLKRRSEIELQEFDLNEVIADSLQMLSPEAVKRNVALHVNGIQQPLLVRADRIHLQQVILNLARNGMDAMSDTARDARRLTIQTALPEGAEVEVSVSDSGMGIPKDKLDVIFDTFYTTKAQGTGLGLSIVRTIVESYGGKIWAENRAEGGAVFRFTLPLLKTARTSGH
jgi:signal transduction histidine kinase